MNQSPAAGLAWSALFHGAVIAAAVWAALHQPPAQHAGVLNIRFQQLSSAITKSKNQSLTATTPRRKRETPKITEPAVPVTAPEQKSVPHTVPLSNFGKSAKRGSEHPAAKATPPAAAPTPLSADPAANIAAGSAGVTSLEGGDFPYTIYIENMKRLIASHWFRPQVAGAISTTVHFTIQRDGTISDAANETNSDNPQFDRAALRAVLEASPLPPLPFGYSGTYLGVHLTFK